MYCPQCDCDYIEGITVCVDCNIQLVEREPEEQPTIIDTELVGFRQFQSAVNAELMKTLLDYNGIPAAIGADDCGGMYPCLNPGNRLELMVRKEDLEEAQKITVEHLEPEPGEQTDENTETDPKKRSNKRNLLLALGLELILIPTIAVLLAWGKYNFTLPLIFCFLYVIHWYTKNK